MLSYRFLVLWGGGEGSKLPCPLCPLPRPGLRRGRVCCVHTSGPHRVLPISRHPAMQTTPCGHHPLVLRWTGALVFLVRPVLKAASHQGERSEMFWLFGIQIKAGWMAFSSRLSCCLPAGSEEAVNLTDHPEEVFFFIFLSFFFLSESGWKHPDAEKVWRQKEKDDRGWDG